MATVNDFKGLYFANGCVFVQILHTHAPYTHPILSQKKERRKVMENAIDTKEKLAGELLEFDSLVNVETLVEGK